MCKLERAFHELDVAADLSGERDRWTEFAKRCAENAREDMAVDERAIATAGRLLELTSPQAGTGTPAPSGDAPDSQFIAALAHLLGSDSRSGGSAWIAAEISSLFGEGEDPPPHPSDGDHIALVSSDSAVGIRAACLLGQILAVQVNGNLTQSSVGDVLSGESESSTIDTSTLDFTRPGVSVVTVGGLTADGRDAVQRSAAGLAEVLGAAYIAARATRKRLLLHSIGGFKATVPLVTALAAHLPIGEGVEVDLWSSNRQTPDGIRLPLLRIGVPNEEYWDLQRIGAGGLVSSRADSLRSARWNGYAWRDNGENLELTEVGDGILRMLAVVDRGKVG